jgi:hypothetical protein
MEHKFIEIRDSNTFIPALAIRISRDDGYLARRAGFGDACVYLIHLEGGRCSYDPYDWTNRTLATAHQYIEREWTSLQDGAVVDVEFILGETLSPKKSEEELGGL